MQQAILWCGPGSNRRHKDFQSFALPTELPHHFQTGGKNSSFKQKTITFAHLFFTCRIHSKNESSLF